MLKISIVIRTFNEEKHIKELMEMLKKQTYRNFEIIIVDSQSTDKTIEIASRYLDDLNIKLVEIEKKDFDYSFASNLGVNNSCGDIICFLSGHSVPVSENYLSTINDIFQKGDIGGCYGDVIAHKDGSIYEKIYSRLGVIKNNAFRKNKIIKLEKKFHKGMLSCSNASIRKEILLRHPFARELGKNGGEDLEVAYRILKDGMYIAMSPHLIVKHSHGNGLFKFIKELNNWKKIYNEVLEYIHNCEKEEKTND